MQAIEDEFLQFVHRFRFAGVSNHLQGQELFELWRRHLRLKEIFEDLHTEITSGTRYLFNRAASRGAQTGQRLSVIATFGVIAGLAFSFLGMNVLAQSDTLGRVLAGLGVHDPVVKESPLLQFVILVWTVTIFTIPASLGLFLFGRSGRRRRWAGRTLAGRRGTWVSRSIVTFWRSVRWDGGASTFDRRFAGFMVCLALVLFIASIFLYFWLLGGQGYSVITDYS